MQVTRKYIPCFNKQGISIYLMNPERVLKVLRSYLFYYKFQMMLQTLPKRVFTGEPEFIFVDY